MFRPPLRLRRANSSRPGRTRPGDYACVPARGEQAEADISQANTSYGLRFPSCPERRLLHSERTNTMKGSGMDHSSLMLPSEGARNPVEYLPGAILWLPPKSEIPWSSSSELPPGRYNHPVAILGAPGAGNVAILTVSTLNYQRSLHMISNAPELVNLFRRDESRDCPLS